jgi:hypothetical protein
MQFFKEHAMNISMQIGRGLTALVLGAALSGYALTHAATIGNTESTRSIPILAAISVTAPRAGAINAHVEHKQRESCGTSVVVGMPITLGEKPAAKNAISAAGAL